MTRNKLFSYSFAVLAALAALLCAVGPVKAQDKKPNILVIWGDDIGIYNISAYNLGVMGYKTPNIDRISKEGLCSPTPMRSKVARLAEPPSFSDSIRSALACSPLVCRGLRKVSPIGRPPSRTY